MYKNIYNEKTFISDLLRQQSNLMIDFNTLIILVLGINLLTCGIEKILSNELLKQGLVYLIAGIFLVTIYIVIYLGHKLNNYKYNIYILTGWCLNVIEVLYQLKIMRVRKIWQGL